MSEKNENLNFKRECLYNMNWQILRVAFLGSFAKMGSAIVTLSTCQAYIDDCMQMGEKSLRVYRVNNYLAATLLALKSQEDKQDIYNLVKQTQDKISAMWKSEDIQAAFRMKENIGWNWNLVGSSINESTDEEIAGVYKDLQKRVYTANRKERKGIGGMSYREELAKFIGMLEDEMVWRKSLDEVQDVAQ